MVNIIPNFLVLHFGENSMKMRIKIAKLQIHEQHSNLHFQSKNSKWVWSGNTTITKCRQTHGTARKSHTTITRHQEDKLSKATSSLFPIKMIAKLEEHKALMNLLIFATIHNLMKYINMINSCQAHLPIQYTLIYQIHSQEVILLLWLTVSHTWFAHANQAYSLLYWRSIFTLAIPPYTNKTVNTITY